MSLGPEIALPRKPNRLEVESVSVRSWGRACPLLQGASSIHLSDSASCSPFRPGSASLLMGSCLLSQVRRIYTTTHGGCPPFNSPGPIPLKQFGLQLPQCSSSLSNDTPTEGTLRILRQRKTWGPAGRREPQVGFLESSCLWHPCQ